MNRNSSREQPSISEDNVKTALLRSGYLMEYRIENLLSNNSYYVEASPVYPDPITQKSREYDLYAMNLQSDPDSMDLLFNCLFIECINNPQPIAFITKKTRLSKTFHYDIKMSGIPLRIIEDKNKGRWQSLADLLQIYKFHHYCKGRISTQYCSFVKKKNSDEWMAYHEDSHFESIQKLCYITKHNIEDLFRQWVPGKNESMNIEIYYPIMIVQGDLYDVRLNGNNISIKKSNHIHFRQNVIHKNSEETYDIDIITESYCSSLLKIIDDEMDEILKRINTNKKAIDQSINLIVSKAKKAKTFKDRVKAFSF